MVWMTVGLPLFRAERIGWLALKGLCAQEGAPEWELVMVEEDVARLEPMGWKEISNYVDRLREANCRAIDYRHLKRWVPLSQKWREIARRSDGQSRVLVLQAADCYAQPQRLAETWELLRDGEHDWCQSRRGYFYSIKNDRVYEFNSEILDHPCALNMAVRMELVRRLPLSDKARSVDGWLYDMAMAQKGRPLKVVHNESENWKKGVDTHGLGNISITRDSDFENLKGVYTKRDVKIDEIIPREVAERIRELRGMVRDNEELRPWKKWGEELGS